MSQRKVPIPEQLFSEGLQTQGEMLAVRQSSKKLFIGIPSEESFQENRVSLKPASVGMLVGNGHRVVVEKGAGEKSGYSDHAYSEAGADIAYSKEQVFKAQVMLMVAPPTAEEIELMSPEQVIISPIHLPMMKAEYIEHLRRKRVIALAWEYIQDATDMFPFVQTISEISGTTAILTAAELLANTNDGRGILLGGISGVPPARVVILGAGIVGESATRTALGLGAEVRVFDDNIYKLMRLQSNLNQRLHTSVINPKYLEEELLKAHVVIGAIHSESGRAPVVVSEDMVSKMRRKSVIVDVSIDQGGCIATSRVTTHDKPTFVNYDVIRYCVPNITSKVARTASSAISNIVTPMLLETEHTGGLTNLLEGSSGFRHGVYIYKGTLTNQHLGERFGIKSTDIGLLLASRL